MLKQISPNASPGAPQEVPANTAPSSSTSSAGTAAGFTGLFGYLIGSAFLANIGMGYIFQHFGWDGGFIALIGACVLLTARQQVVRRSGPGA